MNLEMLHVAHLRRPVKVGTPGLLALSQFIPEVEQVRQSCPQTAFLPVQRCSIKMAGGFGGLIGGEGQNHRQGFDLVEAEALS